VASAVAFGATTPFVQRFGRGIGPFTTAALLYGGAATFAFVASMALAPRSPPSPVKPSRPVGLRPSDLPRLGVVALLGAVIAPVALAWGLQRTSGITASLLLNLEAVFTVLLARLLWAEPIGGRVGLALLAMTGGGALPVRGGGGGRPLADRDPLRVVLAKGGMGAVAAAILASAFGEGWPPASSARAMALLGACGAGGYGASLALYLRAQRVIGAARTGSIFAAAPFVGAAIAWG